jgi:hypothetical protein
VLIVSAGLFLGTQPALALEWHDVPGGRWAPMAVPAQGQTGFSQMPPSQTGVTFTNALPIERYLTNQILLNGSGVAAGDVDGDGWCDLFFCGIDRPCALYRNLGGWRFEDITVQAGVACEGQASTGAVLADIDGDGHLDLLVNGVGSGTRLFLNDGTGHFHEATRQFGLRPGTGSMSLALADVDGDGYLDLYVANYRSTTFRDELAARFKGAMVNGQFNLTEVNGRSVTNADLVGRYTLDPVLGILENGEPDVLYRNLGGKKFVPVPWTDGTFLDEDGHRIGVPYDWGLSAMFRDLNGDGAPDLYVCNDFHSPDRLWINDGHGRFRAIPRLALRHTSLFSMGVDFADIDRDGSVDFFVADMLSRHHSSRQVQLMDRRPAALPNGILDNRPQYSRNMLFWNRGDASFADIAPLAGVEASEWTWCPVFLDVDLDGFEDLLLVTGHLRDAQNIDIARSIEAAKRQKPMSRLEQLNLRRMFPPLTVPNLAFRNRGNLTFEERSAQWGFHSTRVSQGIALADLDNDGDLDIAINCLNDGPLLLRNDSTHPRVAVRLRGTPPNTQGVGAKIRIEQSGMPPQGQEVICGGRYLSSDEPLRVFAAGRQDSELTIVVDWRSGRRSVLAEARPNRLYEIDEAQATQASRTNRSEPSPLFVEVSRLVAHRHVDADFDDFKRQPLLPFKLSQLGPGLTWFDLDEDGWEDLIVPSGRGGKLAGFRNNGHGAFELMTNWPFHEPVPQDQTTVLGCLSEEGHALLIAGNSNYEEERRASPAGRIYDLADRKSPEALPAQLPSTGALALGDLEGKGRLSLFVGGRVIPGRFPEEATSMLLRRAGDAYQLDSVLSRAFDHAGLVSGAVWSDLDGDGFPELVLACDPGPIRIFRFAHGQAVELTEALGLAKYSGLWNSVAAGDFDGDGRLDLIAGNWGRNSKYEAHARRPIHFYYGAVPQITSFPIIEAYYDDELKTIVPWRDWETLASSLPFLRDKYHSFTEFSTAGVSEFLADQLSLMKDLKVNTLDSMLFLNRSDHFEAHPLPREAQLAPVFGIGIGDFDGDGNEDVFLSQNFFETHPLDARLDAGRGMLLLGDGHGGLNTTPSSRSGLRVWGDGRGVAVCDYDHDGRSDLAVAQNANATLLYHNVGAKPGLRVRLHGPWGNPHAVGATVRLEYRDGRLGSVREIHAGSGYWSQDASTQVLGKSGAVQAVLVRWPGGRITRVPLDEGVKELDIK